MGVKLAPDAKDLDKRVGGALMLKKHWAYRFLGLDRVKCCRDTIPASASSKSCESPNGIRWQARLAGATLGSVTWSPEIGRTIQRIAIIASEARRSFFGSPASFKESQGPKHPLLVVAAYLLLFVGHASPKIHRSYQTRVVRTGSFRYRPFSNGFLAKGE